MDSNPNSYLQETNVLTVLADITTTLALAGSPAQVHPFSILVATPPARSIMWT